MECEVPIHIDNEHIERNIVFAESAHQILKFLVAVCPITRPPRTKSEPRRQRDFACHPGEVGERLLVVVSVAEEIPILTISFRTLHYPWPRALLASRKTKIIRVEERTLGVVHQHPAVARDQARIDRFARLSPECAVEGARRALKIAFVLQSRMPCDLIAIEGQVNVQIV